MSESNSFDAGESVGSETNGCPECRGTLVTEGGERVCGACGLVVEEYHLDHGPERRGFDDGGVGSTERTGAPLTPARHDRGLSTEIGRGPDGNGNALGGRQRWRLSRMRRQHDRSRFKSKAERNLSHGFTEMNRLRSALELPRSVHDRACVLFREAQAADLLRGRSIESMAAGCVYAVCREQALLRTLDDVVAVAACDAASVQNGYRVVRAELGLSVRPRRPVEFVPRLTSETGASSAARERAMELAEMATEAGIDNGRNPAGVAATCVYLATKTHGPSKTQAAVAEAAGVTPTTIRAQARVLSEVFDQ